MINFQEKYFKYKQKYLNLIGGTYLTRDDLIKLFECHNLGDQTDIDKILAIENKKKDIDSEYNKERSKISDDLFKEKQRDIDFIQEIYKKYQKKLIKLCNNKVIWPEDRLDCWFIDILYLINGTIQQSSFDKFRALPESSLSFLDDNDFKELKKLNMKSVDQFSDTDYSRVNLIYEKFKDKIINLSPLYYWFRFKLLHTFKKTQK